MLSGWLHIYMDNNQNFIKVGRISSKVEKNLNITLTSNPSIFLNEGFLDALASKRPNSYPNDIIEITNLVKKPNFVFYLRENKELVYAKTYILDHATYFLVLYVSRSGKPKRWYGKMFKCMPLSNCSYLFNNYDSTRIS